MKTHKWQANFLQKNFNSIPIFVLGMFVSLYFILNGNCRHFKNISPVSILTEACLKMIFEGRWVLGTGQLAIKMNIWDKKLMNFKNKWPLDTGQFAY